MFILEQETGYQTGVTRSFGVVINGFVNKNTLPVKKIYVQIKKGRHCYRPLLIPLGLNIWQYRENVR